MPDILSLILADDRFSVETLTKLVLEEDYAPGQISSLGIFEPQPVTTDKVSVEHMAGKFSVVPTAIRGESPTPYLPDKRTAFDFTVPHIPHETLIKAEYLQNMRAVGSGDQMQTVQGEVVRRLGMMARNIDGTIEHKLAGALRGIILDADDSTVIVNLYTQFGVSVPATVHMDLTNGAPAAGAVKRKTNGVVRSIGDSLGAATYQAIYALCGPAFFDDFVCNAEVENSFQRFSDSNTVGTVGAFTRDSQVRQPPFRWGGILWEEYRGGSSFINDDEAIVFPVGVPDLYVLHYAPANFMEYVNTPGLPRYAKVWMTDNSGRSLTGHVQSNPLPLCTRPGVLRRLTRGA